MTVTIGQLREQIKIQKFTEIIDAGGGRARTWADFVTVHANVKPVKGREGNDAGRLASLQTFLVTIRYRADFDTTARILWGTRYLNIRSVENRDERKRFMTLECEEGVQND